MPTAAELLRDRSFYKLPIKDQLDQLRSDEEFRNLDLKEQGELLSLAGQRFNPIPGSQEGQEGAPSNQKPIVEHVKDFGRTLLDAGRGTLTSVGQFMVGNPEGIKSIVRPQVEQFGKAREEFNRGNNGQAAARVAAGMIPFAGPLAADLGDSIGDREYGKAAAQAAMLYGGMKGSVNRLAGEGVSAVQNARIVPRTGAAMKGAISSLGEPQASGAGSAIGALTGAVIGSPGGPLGMAKGAAFGGTVGRYGPAMAKGAVKGWQARPESPIIRGMQDIKKLAPDPKYPEPFQEPPLKIESEMPNYKVEYDPELDFPVKYQKRTVTRKARPSTIRKTSDGYELYSHEEAPFPDPPGYESPVESPQPEEASFDYSKYGKTPETKAPEPKSQYIQELSKQINNVVDPEGKNAEQLKQDTNPTVVKEKRLLTDKQFRERANLNKLEKYFKEGDGKIVSDNIDVIPDNLWEDLKTGLKIKDITPEMKRELKIRLKL